MCTAARAGKDRHRFDGGLIGKRSNLGGRPHLPGHEPGGLEDGEFSSPAAYRRDQGVSDRAGREQGQETGERERQPAYPFEVPYLRRRDRW